METTDNVQKPLTTKKPLTRMDFQSGQSIRWCPGCGDYAILTAVQRVLAEAQVKKENTVFVSGIGCSSRFPYYMATYGFHTIHGRAPSVATGVKLMRPDLSVWIISGDGDSLSIGANHFVHLIRRNIDVNYLIFNNRIYGLTKGQFSPTSEKGKVTRSSPRGTGDRPLNPIALALASGATFVARSIDRNIKHLSQTLQQAMNHRGTSVVEIYQNCNIFNDGAFENFTDSKLKNDYCLWLEKGKPLVYGGEQKKIMTWDEKKKGQIIAKNISEDQANGENLSQLVHDPSNKMLANFYSQLDEESHPSAFGVIYQDENSSEKIAKETAPSDQSARDAHVQVDSEQRRKEKLKNLQEKIQQTHTWNI